MATAGSSPSRKIKLKKQSSQTSVTTQDSVDHLQCDVDIDSVMNKRWKYEEVNELLQSQLAILPGGRDKNGGGIIIIEGSEAHEYSCVKLGKILSYLSKIPEDSIQRKGFTVVLDMRQANWSQAKKALDSLKLTFIEHISQVIVMRPKSFWQRGKSSMSFSFNKSKYGFKCILLEHSADLFHHVSISHVPVSQNGQLQYIHQQWMEIQKATENYLLQMMNKHENYLILQETLHQNPSISSLEDARDAVKHHINLQEQLDRSLLNNLTETISHSTAKLRPLTSNPDFDYVFIRLEELSGQLHSLFSQLEILWERKGEKLDKILQFKIFESDASKHVKWLEEKYTVICQNMTDVGESVVEAEENKTELDEFRCHVNSQHQGINRTIEMGERLMKINHPKSQEIHQQCNDLGTEWETLNEIVEERMGMMFLAVNFYTKYEKFLQSSEVWLDECGLRTKPDEVKDCELAIESHKALKESFNALYTLAKQDGYNLIEKLRRPIGNRGVPRSFTLATRYTKECLETLYDEKTLIDDQWLARQDHIKKTLNLRMFQQSTAKIFKWISDVGNHFLLTNVTIGSDVDSATKLLKQHDTFESDSEVPVVYSQSSLLHTRSLELITANDCRQDEIELESQKLDNTMNTFASQLDERRDILVLSIECFKAFNNFFGELDSIKRPLPREKFEGSLSQLEEYLSRFKTHREIIRKISLSTFKLWTSLLQRLASPRVLGMSQTQIDCTLSIDYVKERIQIMEEKEQHVDGLCQQRENHWNLSIERHSLIANMIKLLKQLDEWNNEQNVQKEVPENLMDAELQMDIFKRRYDQQKEECDSLIERGWEINEYLVKLDLLLFGVGVVTGKEMKERIEITIIKVEKSKDKMTKIAEPKLMELNEYVQYFRLEQEYKKLNDNLKQVSNDLSTLIDVGQNMKESNDIHNTLEATDKQFIELSSQVFEFNLAIKDCEAKNTYQSSALSMFGRAITEKNNSIGRIIKDKKRVVKGAVDFHSNYDKLTKTVEHCQTQFCSRDVGSSHIQIEAQLTTMKDMRVHLEEAVIVVKSHADQLVTILRSSQASDVTIGKKGSAEDLRSTPVEGGPKLLVSPRKVRQEKSSSPGPSAATGQQILEGLIKDMDRKVSYVIKMWESRHDRLEQSKKVIEFENEVPKVLEWLDRKELHFITKRCEYGKSIEEVHKLIQKYEDFNAENVKPTVEQVEKLQQMMKEFEETGHSELNRIRSIGNQFQQRWEKFELSNNSYGLNLKLSLEFQEKLFDGSNWCMQSEQFLQSLDDKVNKCETSEEVGSLAAELSAYLLVTQGEQLERVSKIKEISTVLHSNPLVELSQQLDSSTQQIIREFETVKRELQTLYSKLVQIEEEKDKEMRLMKQKQRVIEELIATEESYVQDLKLVVDTCKPRFVSDFLPDSLRGKETIVFGNIQWIAELHIETLLPSLLAANGDINAIAQVFIDNVDILTDLYVPYCKNKTASEELLASHRTYLSRVQSLFGTDYPLSSLLIKPIQRITKYPLLLKDALKYQRQLNLPSELLEYAILAVEEPPIQTNNAINLSLLQSEEGLPWHKYGELLHQGSLLVSEPRLLITSEKERQVFVFENTIAFARKIDLGQAKFKYEYKFAIQITTGVQVIEFLEGEPCKFGVFTSDHRMHFRASSIESKQRWVKFLRLSIHKHEEEQRRIRSLTETNRTRSNALLTNDKLATDLRERRRSPATPGIPRRPSSPFSKSRLNQQSVSPPPVDLDTYKVKIDYEPFADDDHGISLKKDQKVEVMEIVEDGRWFVKATTITGQIEHGWIPSSVLEGPLPPEILFSDEDDHLPIEDTDLPYDARRNTTAFGSRDIASQQVISTLKKVTLGDELQSSPKSSPRSSPKLPKNQNIGRSSPLVQRKPFSQSSSNQLPPLTSPIGENNPIDHNNGAPPGSPRNKLERKVVVRKQSKNIANRSEDIPEINELPPLKVEQPSSTTVTINEEDNEKLLKRKEEAEQKLKYIMAELVDTEQEYVTKLDKLVNSYLKEMQNSTELPESLVGKEKMIFGNVEAIYEFHRDVFKNLLETNKDSLEGIATCFLEKRAEFSVYVSYCENKPKSESFIWTYTHQGGTFFKDIQQKLGLREDIASFLIKPVQRITKYQLLLKDLFKTSEKLGLGITVLEESVQLMKDVPKQANDAMALSMIVDYQGNIHANGQIIIQDEFTVYERSRWSGGAKRHVFLLDRVLIITKEKDNDGLYVFKDSVKVHNMFHLENSDSNTRFTIGTGNIANPDKSYILEAISPEKKQEWTKIIKDLLKLQFEMLKALKQPNRSRNSTVDNPDPVHRVSITASECLVDDISDSDLEEEEDEPSPYPLRKRSSALLPEDDTRKHIPFTMSRSPSTSPNLSLQRQPKLYIAGDDCPPPVDGQKILYIRKGQIYDILSQNGDWWLGKLIRDVNGNDSSRGIEGWVPSTFMDSFQGQLSYEEEAYLKWGDCKIKSDSKFATLPLRLRDSSPSTTPNHNRHSILSKIDEKKKKKDLTKTPKSQRKSKGPRIVSQLVDETVLKGQNVQFSCILSENYSGMTVEWLVNGKPLKRDRAFTSSGKTCILKIQDIIPSDEGTYVCQITLPNGGQSSSTAKLTVLSPPCSPGQPTVKQITSTSVSLSWPLPLFNGHSQITVYLVECKDAQGDKWSTIMKRITEPTTIVSDLVPGTKYVFRVLASNSIGSSEPSIESEPFYLSRQTSAIQSVFSLDPFNNNYTLDNELAKGQFSTVHECIHNATQQIYVAKLMPLSVGREHAYNELSILSKINHNNILQMAAAYLTERHYVIVLHYIHGVPLFEYFTTSNPSASSVVVMQCVFAVISGLAYLHEENIVHLAVKPNNILVKQKLNGGFDIKLIHLSHARDISTKTVIGSPSDNHIEYNAPELLLHRPVSTGTDMWSVGVLLYTLLAGTPPFVVDSVDLTKENIKEARLNVFSRIFKGISNEPKKLIQRLLQKDPSVRLTANQCLQEVWIQTGFISTKPGIGIVLDMNRLKGHIDRTSV